MFIKIIHIKWKPNLHIYKIYVCYKCIFLLQENNEIGWDVLRDDFMGGSKIKDWDKQIENDNEENDINI